MSFIWLLDVVVRTEPHQLLLLAVGLVLLTRLRVVVPIFGPESSPVRLLIRPRVPDSNGWILISDCGTGTPLCSAVEVKENSARIGWDIIPRRKRVVLRNFMVRKCAGACEPPKNCYIGSCKAATKRYLQDRSKTSGKVVRLVVQVC